MGRNDKKGKKGKKGKKQVVAETENPMAAETSELDDEPESDPEPEPEPDPEPPPPPEPAVVEEKEEVPVASNGNGKKKGGGGGKKKKKKPDPPKPKKVKAPREVGVTFLGLPIFAPKLLRVYFTLTLIIEMLMIAFLWIIQIVSIEPRFPSRCLTGCPPATVGPLSSFISLAWWYHKPLTHNLRCTTPTGAESRRQLHPNVDIRGHAGRAAAEQLLNALEGRERCSGDVDDCRDCARSRAAVGATAMAHEDDILPDHGADRADCDLQLWRLHAGDLLHG